MFINIVGTISGVRLKPRGNKLLSPVFIKATDLNDAWHQALFAILENGRKFKIDTGSFAGEIRLEFDYITIHITHPSTRPLEPQIPPHLNIPNPVPPGYILGDHPDFKGRPYIEYLMSGAKEEGESYTYGERIAGYSYTHIHLPTGEYFDFHLNQIEEIVYNFKTFGYRTNQMILQIARPEDLNLTDPPCLRHIDLRIQDNKLHFFPYFRSWDLWAGFPANLAAIQILKEYMAGEIGVEDGEIIASSKGLHIYGYAEEIVKLRRGK
jgi:thymidylate synthase